MEVLLNGNVSSTNSWFSTSMIVSGSVSASEQASKQASQPASKQASKADANLSKPPNIKKMLLQGFFETERKREREREVEKNKTKRIKTGTHPLHIHCFPSLTAFARRLPFDDLPRVLQLHRVGGGNPLPWTVTGDGPARGRSGCSLCTAGSGIKIWVKTPLDCN